MAEETAARASAGIGASAGPRSRRLHFLRAVAPCCQAREKSETASSCGVTATRSCHGAAAVLVAVGAADAAVTPVPAADHDDGGKAALAAGGGAAAGCHRSLAGLSWKFPAVSRCGRSKSLTRSIGGAGYTRWCFPPCIQSLNRRVRPQHRDGNVRDRNFGPTLAATPHTNARAPSCPLQRRTRCSLKPMVSRERASNHFAVQQRRQLVVQLARNRHSRHYRACAVAEN